MAGTADSIKVYYQRVSSGNRFWQSSGFVKNTHTPSGNYVFNLSGPYSALTWWPCKERVTSDKADSADITIHAPSTFRVAANGKRISEITARPNTVGTSKADAN